MLLPVVELERAARGAATIWWLSVMLVAVSWVLALAASALSIVLWACTAVVVGAYAVVVTAKFMQMARHFVLQVYDVQTTTHRD
jgi:hypothetical protein